MKDYKINGKVIEITLDNGKVVKCATEWVEKSMKALETDMEDVLLMFLEDNDYIVNEEQEELDKQAKGKVKLVAKTEKPVKKTIQTIYNALQQIDSISSVNVENKAKLITFELNNEQFKIDLVQKRKPKEK